MVDSFKYLGTMFFENGSWNRTKKCIADYALFALHKLNIHCSKNITLSDSGKFKLFDCLVESVLSYSSEVWGFHKAPDIERVHTRFCRSLLVRLSVCRRQYYTIYPLVNVAVIWQGKNQVAMCPFFQFGYY